MKRESIQKGITPNENVSLLSQTGKLTQVASPHRTLNAANSYQTSPLNERNQNQDYAYRTYSQERRPTIIEKDTTKSVVHTQPYPSNYNLYHSRSQISTNVTLPTRNYPQGAYTETHQEERAPREEAEQKHFVTFRGEDLCQKLQDELEREKKNVMKAFEEKLEYQNKVDALEEQLAEEIAGKKELMKENEQLKSRTHTQAIEMNSMRAENADLRATLKTRDDQKNRLERLELQLNDGLLLLKNLLNEGRPNAGLEGQISAFSKNFEEFPSLLGIVELYNGLKGRLSQVTQTGSVSGNDPNQQLLLQLKKEVECINAALQQNGKENDYHRTEARGSHSDLIAASNRALDRSLKAIRKHEPESKESFVQVLSAFERLIGEAKALTFEISKLGESVSSDKNSLALLFELERSLNRLEGMISERRHSSESLSLISKELQDLGGILRLVLPVINEAIADRKGSERKASKKELVSEVESALTMVEEIWEIAQKFEKADRTSTKNLKSVHFESDNNEKKVLLAEITNLQKLLKEASARVEGVKKENLELKEQLDEAIGKSRTTEPRVQLPMQHLENILNQLFDTVKGYLRESSANQQKMLDDISNYVADVEEQTKILESSQSRDFSFEKLRSTCKRILLTKELIAKEARSGFEYEANIRRELKENILNIIKNIQREQMEGLESPRHHHHERRPSGALKKELRPSLSHKERDFSQTEKFSAYYSDRNQEKLFRKENNESFPQSTKYHSRRMKNLDPPSENSEEFEDNDFSSFRMRGEEDTKYFQFRPARCSDQEREVKKQAQKVNKRSDSQQFNQKGNIFLAEDYIPQISGEKAFKHSGRFAD